MRFKVACLSDAVAALEAASHRGRTAVLESPGRVVEIEGSAWFLALVRQARAKVPQAVGLSLVDAGCAAALALDAMKRGADIVRIDKRLRSRARLQAIAKAIGIVLEIRKGTL
jgi:hypothetical protein